MDPKIDQPLFSLNNGLCRVLRYPEQQVAESIAVEIVEEAASAELVASQTSSEDRLDEGEQSDQPRRSGWWQRRG